MPAAFIIDVFYPNLSSTGLAVLVGIGKSARRAALGAFLGSTFFGISFVLLGLGKGRG